MEATTITAGAIPAPRRRSQWSLAWQRYLFTRDEAWDSKDFATGEKSPLDFTNMGWNPEATPYDPDRDPDRRRKVNPPTHCSGCHR